MANRLADATSPYLLPHKDNPVDWWRWSPEAFAEAERQDAPVTGPAIENRARPGR